MGSGKSTVARALARRLNSKMIDLDELIAQTEGRSPAQIIKENGEIEFREIETRALRTVLQNEGAPVVSLGGGAWTLEKNRALIAKSDATTVWLDVPFSLCWRRILTSGAERPLAPNEHEAQMLYEKRREAYECADLHIVASETKSPDEIALEITQATVGLKK